MVQKARLIVAVPILLWMATAWTAAGAQDPVAAAEAAAKAGAATPDGKKFEEAVGQAFGREHSATISRCAKEVKRPDLTNFDLLLRMDGDGSVDEVLVKPATNLSECVRVKLKAWKVAAPPHAGFWVKIAVNLKR